MKIIVENTRGRKIVTHARVLRDGSIRYVRIIDNKPRVIDRDSIVTLNNIVHLEDDIFADIADFMKDPDS